MLESAAYTLSASAVGIVAGLWLCVGSAFTSPATIADLATSYWDYHKAHADVVIAQSAQYSVGAPLLVLAFALQVLAVLATPTSQLSLPRVLSSPLAFLLCILLPAWGLSFLAYKLLLRVKGARVHTILKRSLEKS